MSGTERISHPCPICRKPAIKKHHPFCSVRCSQIDLHRWLGGSYAIPADEVPPDEDQGSSEN
jgi:uncharacterized protein